MASITTWMRLEPHSRSAEMEASLEMRIHDPLWMLARQWQFGEFLAEDAGSPVWAAYSGWEMPIRLYLPGRLDDHDHNDVQEYQADVPLEYLVEQERTPAHEVMLANRRLAAEAGQYFLRLLPESIAQAHRSRLLRDYGFSPLTDAERKSLDAQSVAFLDLMARRALDGAKLLNKLGGVSPESGAIALGFDPADARTIGAKIAAWLEWCEQMVGPILIPSNARSSWNPERMEYSCAIAAPKGAAGDQIVLAATEYPGGHLDWYSFDAIGDKLKREIGIDSQAINAGTLPTALSFRGLPSNRIWEFEDAQVSFGSIKAAPTDLARTLLAEFLIQYGNDFFNILIEIQAGSLFRLDQLTITNTFGDRTPALPFVDQSWRMFALSADPDLQAAVSPSMLFLPPVLGQHLTSPPIENLHLLRDEMANLAWAVEHLVESADGKALNRHEAYQALRQRQEEDNEVDKQPVGEGTLVYRLDTWQFTLPDYWVPLLPKAPVLGKSPVRLECYDPQGHSQGQLLSELKKEAVPSLYDEEVPRSGAHVTRSQQYTRWYGGSTFAWIGREKRQGRGEGTSGLRYDIVEVVEAS